jgi:hypothetical protein
MRRVILPVLLLLATALHAAVAGVTLRRESGGVWILENESVRVRFARGPNGYAETYWSLGDRWRLVLEAGSKKRADLTLKADGRATVVRLASINLAETTGTRIAVQLQGSMGVHRVTKTVTMEQGDPFVRVEIYDVVEGLSEVSSLLSTCSFVPDGKHRVRPDLTWTPQLRPDPDDVIADHTFRSPAVIVQRGTVVAALVPAVERIVPWRSIQTCADLQAGAEPGPMLSYGAMNWRQRSHVFYTHSDKMTTQFYKSRFWYGYYVYVDCQATAGEGYRPVVRFHWDRTGRKNFLGEGGPQRVPFREFERKAWTDYAGQVGLDTTLGGIPVTLLRQGRLSWSNELPLSANNDCWFTVWFNALRTAYGWYRYGAATGDSTKTARAVRVLNLALAAPQEQGIGPSIFYIDSTGGHWVGDQGWGGIREGRCYSTFNNAWNNYWLLQWADLVPEQRERIYSRCGAFARFLLSRQSAAGGIPSWIEPGTLQPADTFRTGSAEVAGAALFLAAWYERSREPAVLQAAERAVGYLRAEVIPQRKWFDFETFFSCSRKTPGFHDPFTRQYAQNTLVMDQAAAACALLARVTGERFYRDLGTAILDYLLLYQQVWSPAWLSRALFGGFGVQNTDGEWSDARQGYFAMTLSDYFELTGEREYLERSVAAARAMFSLFESAESPRTGENYAHSAIDRLGGVTGIHWGTGSSAVSLGMLRARYGDALVDVAGAWGVGIDGCRITEVRAEGRSVSVILADNVATPRSILVRFKGVDPGVYDVRVNGTMVGSFGREQLQGGISVAIK